MTSSNPSKDRLRIALQKSGRLASDSLELLARCGVRIKSPKERLMLHAENFPLDVLFVRDDDIPQLVMDNVCDLGLVGTNVLEESALDRVACVRAVAAALKRSSNGANAGYSVERTLNFGRCRLALAIPEERTFNGIADLNGLRIATTYPRLLQRYLDEKGISAGIVTLSGSVEIAPRLGLADAICDLVSTGSTLDANRLKAVETIYKSQAALIRAGRALNEKQQHTLDILMRRIEGVLKADETKYIMLHAPKDRLDEIRRLLPGAENPTILPLAGDESKVALHAVCSEDVFWETMESLKKAGASSILVLPIEKMML